VIGKTTFFKNDYLGSLGSFCLETPKEFPLGLRLSPLGRKKAIFFLLTHLGLFMLILEP
jgi:hypothetical protein